jgi:hypothetical protein
MQTRRDTRVNSGRRSFAALCACAACAGWARAAAPSSRNAKSLKEAAAGESGERPAAEKPRVEVAYCGIYCAACELHLKGKKDGKKCKGCTHPSMESKCLVFACAKERKVANCGLCAEFESCETLRKHHEKPLYRQAARRTCAAIKADGMEKALAAQKARWTCPACGKLFPWNTGGACPSCGKPVAALSDKDA